MKTIIALLVLCGVCIFGLWVYVSNSQQPSARLRPDLVEAKSAKRAVSISAEALFAAYETNEVAADAEYKDDVLLVSGTVERIGKDIFGDPYVTLKTQAKGIGVVQAMIRKGKQAALLNLAPGQAVTIQGKCAGKMMNVMLKDAELWP